MDPIDNMNTISHRFLLILMDLGLSLLFLVIILVAVTDFNGRLNNEKQPHLETHVKDTAPSAEALAQLQKQKDALASQIEQSRAEMQKVGDTNARLTTEIRKKNAEARHLLAENSILESQNAALLTQLEQAADRPPMTAPPEADETIQNPGFPSPPTDISSQKMLEASSHLLALQQENAILAAQLAQVNDALRDLYQQKALLPTTTAHNREANTLQKEHTEGRGRVPTQSSLWDRLVNDFQGPSPQTAQDSAAPPSVPVAPASKPSNPVESAMASATVKAQPIKVVDIVPTLGDNATKMASNQQTPTVQENVVETLTPQPPTGDRAPKTSVWDTVMAFFRTKPQLNDEKQPRLETPVKDTAPSAEALAQWQKQKDALASQIEQSRAEMQKVGDTNARLTTEIRKKNAEARHLLAENSILESQNAALLTQLEQAADRPPMTAPPEADETIQNPGFPSPPTDISSQKMLEASSHLLALQQENAILAAQLAQVNDALRDLYQQKALLPTTTAHNREANTLQKEHTEGRGRVPTQSSLWDRLVNDFQGPSPQTAQDSAAPPSVPVAPASKPSNPVESAMASATVKAQPIKVVDIVPTLGDNATKMASNQQTPTVQENVVETLTPQPPTGDRAPKTSVWDTVMAFFRTKPQTVPLTQTPTQPEKTPVKPAVASMTANPTVKTEQKSVAIPPGYQEPITVDPLMPSTEPKRVFMATATQPNKKNISTDGIQPDLGDSRSAPTKGLSIATLAPAKSPSTIDPTMNAEQKSVSTSPPNPGAINRDPFMPYIEPKKALLATTHWVGNTDSSTNMANTQPVRTTEMTSAGNVPSVPEMNAIDTEAASKPISISKQTQPTTGEASLPVYAKTSTSAPLPPVTTTPNTETAVHEVEHEKTVPQIEKKGLWEGMLAAIRQREDTPDSKQVDTAKISQPQPQPISSTTRVPIQSPTVTTQPPVLDTMPTLPATQTTPNGPSGNTPFAHAQVGVPTVEMIPVKKYPAPLTIPSATAKTEPAAPNERPTPGRDSTQSAAPKASYQPRDLLVPPKPAPIILTSTTKNSEGPDRVPPSPEAIADARTRLLTTIRTHLEKNNIPAEINVKEGTLYLPGLLEFQENKTTISQKKRKGMRILANTLANNLFCFTHNSRKVAECADIGGDVKLDALVIVGNSGPAPIGSKAFRKNWDLANTRALQTFETLLKSHPRMSNLRNAHEQSLFRLDGFLPHGNTDRSKPMRRVELRFIMDPSSPYARSNP